MKKRWIIALPLLMTLVGGVVSLSSTAESNNDPAAVIARAADFLSNAKTFTLQATASYEIDVDGEIEKADTVLKLALRRPDEASLHMRNEEFNVFFVANDEELTTYVPSMGKYTVEAGGVDPAGLIERASFPPIDSVLVVLSEVVAGEPFSMLTSKASSITYEGIEQVNGAVCHRVRIKIEDAGWDLWIDTGDQPLLRKVTADTTKLTTGLKERGVDMKISVTMNLSEWNLEDAADSLFAFNPPADAQKVDSFRPERDLTPAEQMAGQTAPEFSVDIMGGGTFEIAKKNPEDIIILDFWATWCGPCRGAMPILSKVSKEFASQGVKLFAMNLREETKDIQTFLDSQKLDITVALDREGKIATKYRVDGIPQTVIIGQDGTIQVVHVGLLPDLEGVLRADLTKLVKGETIARKSS